MEKRTFEHPIIGDKVTFIKTSAETQGDYTLLDVELKAGGANSLHFHRSFSEKFEVISGELEVQVKKELKVLRTGETYTVPPMVLHNFRNRTHEPIKFRVEIRPGHAGFENCLKIGYGLASDGLTNKKGIPRTFSHLATILSMSDTNLPGILTMLTSFLKWRAALAKKKGIEQKLIETYC
jgi:mannose-6-phosphate isomerase-like protein (cupin superfamily)